MPRPFRSALIVLLAISLTTSGCRVWGVTGTPPTEFLRNHKPTQVRIHRKDGKQIVLMEPELTGDSLRGYAETTGRPTIALADIDSIAVRRTSWGKTVLLVTGVSAAIVATALLSSCDDARSVC